MKIPSIDIDKVLSLKHAVEAGEIEDNSPEFDVLYDEAVTEREISPEFAEKLRAKGAEILKDIKMRRGL